MEEKPNEPAFPENETVCYDNVSAMDMTIARNMAMTIAIKLQCALGANGFGADRQLVVGRIFDMLQRQSLRRDRSCGAFAQRSRHFSCKPVEERLPIPTCTQPLTRSAPYCVQTRRRRSRSRRGPIPRSAYGTAPHRHAVVDKRPLRYATPIRGLHLAYGGAARIRGGERAEIVQADRHRSGFVHGFEVKFIVDMQYEVSGTRSTSLDLSAIRYT